MYADPLGPFTHSAVACALWSSSFTRGSRPDSSLGTLSAADSFALASWVAFRVCPSQKTASVSLSFCITEALCPRVRFPGGSRLPLFRPLLPIQPHRPPPRPLSSSIGGSPATRTTVPSVLGLVVCVVCWIGRPRSFTSGKTATAKKRQRGAKARIFSCHVFSTAQAKSPPADAGAQPARAPMAFRNFCPNILRRGCLAPQLSCSPSRMFPAGSNLVGPYI